MEHESVTTNERTSTLPGSNQPTIANADVETDRGRRGFAAMPSELVRELAQRGGRSAHRSGRAHQFTSDEAREAGKKGGHASALKRKAARNKGNDGNA